MFEINWAVMLIAVSSFWVGYVWRSHKGCSVVVEYETHESKVKQAITGISQAEALKLNRENTERSAAEVSDD